jgi:hypothetical protein
LGLKCGLRPTPVYFLASSFDKEKHEVDFFISIEEFSSSSPPEIWVPNLARKRLHYTFVGT